MTGGPGAVGKTGTLMHETTLVSAVHHPHHLGESVGVGVRLSGLNPASAT